MAHRLTTYFKTSRSVECGVGNAEYVVGTFRIPHSKFRIPLGFETGSRGTRSFTLVETVIATAIIGLLSTVAVPAARRIRITGNETVAQVGLVSFRTGMVMFYGIYGRYPTDLSELANSTPPFVDTRLAGGNRQGYNYLLSNATGQTYTITAVPEVPAVTGVRWFVLTEGGAIVESQPRVNTTVPGAQIARRYGRWFTDGQEMWTAWSRREALEYEMDFGAEEGFFDIGMSARNHDFWPDANNGHGIPPPSDYQFSVEVYVDGRNVGQIRLDADNHRYDRRNVRAFVSRGRHRVLFDWTNDSYRRDRSGVIHHDANIRIREVFAESARGR